MKMSYFQAIEVQEIVSHTWPCQTHTESIYWPALLNKQAPAIIYNPSDDCLKFMQQKVQKQVKVFSLGSLQWRSYIFSLQRSSPIEGCLPLKVIFHQRCLPWKVVLHQRLSAIEGCLPLKVIFHWRSSFIKGCLLSKVNFHQRVTSIKVCLWLKVSFH